MWLNFVVMHRVEFPVYWGQRSTHEKIRTKMARFWLVCSAKIPVEYDKLALIEGKTFNLMFLVIPVVPTENWLRLTHNQSRKTFKVTALIILKTTSWLEWSSCLSKFPEVTGHSTRRLFRGQKMQSETSIRMSRETGFSVKRSNAEVLSPFLENFRRRFSRPDWRPPGLRGCSWQGTECPSKNTCLQNVRPFITGLTLCSDFKSTGALFFQRVISRLARKVS